MKRHLILIFFLLQATFSYSQDKVVPFKNGEWLQYRLSYSGFLKAGSMSLQLKEEQLNGQKILHAIGKGKTSSIVSWFFHVDDTYESYFKQKNVFPLKSVRNVNEGGYKIHRITNYNYTKNTANIKDFIHKKDTAVSIKKVQDMISTFYFLRNYNTENLNPNDEIAVDMFFDYKTFAFKLKFLRFETVKTKFGKIKAMVFRPIVKSGRVFKAQESVTVWITADDNKIPIQMRAELAVGSLRAELSGYKGLANPFEIVFD